MILQKEVLLMTSTNLSCNPRCLKELKLLLSNGVGVSVLAFNLRNGTDKDEMAIQREFPAVKFYYLETTKRHFFPWAIASLIEKVAKKIVRVFNTSSFWYAMALSKRGWLLLHWVKNNKRNFDVVVAHNPPAFHPAATLACKLKIPLFVDIEDFHPGEGNNDLDKKCCTYLMKEVLPKATFISFASPLIFECTKKLFGNSINSRSIVVNNSFAMNEFMEPELKKKTSDKLQLVWFSQNIDYGRGLDKVLPCLDYFSENIELTLIGSMRHEFFNKEVKKRNYIKLVSFLSQKELHNSLSKYDVGLALEDPTVDLNRNICLTNKIWAYRQAGLYILASDTDAQRQFVKQNPSIGSVFPLEFSQLKKSLEEIIESKSTILFDKKQRFENAKLISWENDCELLWRKWKPILT